MTPIATSYTISKELTGYTADQTINPQELNLWRVLQINSDGTIDMISEYTSSKIIAFSEEVGYKNGVGVLNDIASAYTNSNYTAGSRSPGYDGQTEFITESLSKETSGTIGTDNANWNSTTESHGGGDKLYQTDYALIQKVFNTRIAYKVDEQETPESYWFTSRYVLVNYSDRYEYVWGIRAISSNGNISTNGGVHAFTTAGEHTSNNLFTSRACIRPIIILKADLSPEDGDGSINTPWTFE